MYQNLNRKSFVGEEGLHRPPRVCQTIKPFWLVFLRHTSQDPKIIDACKILCQIRSCTRDIIELFMRIGGLQLYSQLQSAKDLAWGEAMARNEPVQQLLAHLKGASRIF